MSWRISSKARSLASAERCSLGAARHAVGNRSPAWPRRADARRCAAENRRAARARPSGTASASTPRAQTSARLSTSIQSPALRAMPGASAASFARGRPRAHDVRQGRAEQAHRALRLRDERCASESAQTMLEASLQRPLQRPLGGRDQRTTNRQLGRSSGLTRAVSLDVGGIGQAQRDRRMSVVTKASGSSISVGQPSPRRGGFVAMRGHEGVGRSSPPQTSRFCTFVASARMKSLRGPTFSPISTVNMWSASAALSGVDLQQRAGRRVHGRLPELVGVHLAESLEALDGQVLDLHLLDDAARVLLVGGIARDLAGADPIQRRLRDIEMPSLHDAPACCGRRTSSAACGCARRRHRHRPAG